MSGDTGHGEVGRLSVPVGVRVGATDLARRLRGRSTESEERLWRALRGRRLGGRRFRRQQPIGAYVVDFY